MFLISSSSASTYDNELEKSHQFIGKQNMTVQIFNSASQIIPLMTRRRSGALHSDSEQGYTKLASLADEHSALFYDGVRPSKDRRRRKYGVSVNTNKQQPTQQGSNQQPRVDPFKCFDFDQQTDSFRKDCDELAEHQRKRSQATFKTHIAVLCDEESWKVAQLLRQKLGVECNINCPASSHAIDLCISHSFLPDPDTYFIDCYWVINKAQLTLSPNLLAIYLGTCTHLWDITQQQQNEEPETMDFYPETRRSLEKLLNGLYEGRVANHAARS